MTNDTVPEPAPISTEAERETIFATLADAFDRLAPLTDNDEAYSKHCGYGMLALLWDRTPGTDNIDYVAPEVPYEISDQGDADSDRHFAEVLTPVLDQTWATARQTVEQWGPRKVAEALAAGANVDRAWFAWYACVRFDDAEIGYGPQPAGFVITERPGDRSVPYRNRPTTFVVCPSADPYVDYAARERRAEMEQVRRNLGL